jgi:hypothetical protein
LSPTIKLTTKQKKLIKSSFFVSGALLKNKLKVTKLLDALKCSASENNPGKARQSSSVEARFRYGRQQ